MAQNSTISIAYKIEGVDGGCKKLTVANEAIRKLLEANVTEAEKLKKNLLDFAVISSGIKISAQSLQEICSTFSNITSESLDFEKAMKASDKFTLLIEEWNLFVREQDFY